DSLGRDHRLYTSDSILPVEIVPLELQRSDSSNHHAELTTPYTQKLAGGSLRAGYELRREDNDSNYLDEMGPADSALVPQPSLANPYLYEQPVNSGDATYPHRS